MNHSEAIQVLWTDLLKKLTEKNDSFMNLTSLILFSMHQENGMRVNKLY